MRTDWSHPSAEFIHKISHCTYNKRGFFVSLLVAGSGSFQCHRCRSLSIVVWTVCCRGGLSGPSHLVTFQRHQTRFWLVCPPVAENCPQYLQRQHQCRVRVLDITSAPQTSDIHPHISLMPTINWTQTWPLCVSPLIFASSCFGFKHADKQINSV